MISSSLQEGSFLRRFLADPVAFFAFLLLLCMVLVGVYAPLFASSYPLLVHYRDEWFFPLFRYLLFSGAYSKSIDRFFNLLIFTLPLLVVVSFLFKKWRKRVLFSLLLLHFALFFYLEEYPLKDPARSETLLQARREALSHEYETFGLPRWSFELAHLTQKERADRVIDHRRHLRYHDSLIRRYGIPHPPSPYRYEAEAKAILLKQLRLAAEGGDLRAAARVHFHEEEERWLEEEERALGWTLWPLLRSFHWEEDAGGTSLFNREVHWWDLSRKNRKDLMAGLLFGIRVSLLVAIASVGLSCLVAIPVGAFSAYYGGRFDLLLCRFLEMWEAMPAFLMLLIAVAILQAKSLWITIVAIGLFSWTGLSRLLRGEILRQKGLAYVESCHCMGYSTPRILFGHLLPNALFPLLTLLPFSMMAAISAEAGLSFLGLGEEGSCSWGVLMDEGRRAFPYESMLLWPPALILTLLLLSIALLGDRLRDVLDRH